MSEPVFKLAPLTLFAAFQQAYLTIIISIEKFSAYVLQVQK